MKQLSIQLTAGLKLQPVVHLPPAGTAHNVATASVDRRSWLKLAWDPPTTASTKTLGILKIPPSAAGIQVHGSDLCDWIPTADLVDALEV